MLYKAGIINAIDKLKDRTGLSMIAIKKNHAGWSTKRQEFLNVTLISGLKSGIASGDFIHINNSYKLLSEFKKSHIASEKKSAAPNKKAASKKKSVPKKKKIADKKPAPKKKETAAKKSAPKKHTAAKNNKTVTSKNSTKK